MNEPIPVEYNEVRREIRDADLLLFRRRNRIGRLIAVAGRSQYVHAAMAGWWNDRLMCVEMTFGGGRAQLLSNLVARWPGVIDVYAIQKGPAAGGGTGLASGTAGGGTGLASGTAGGGTGLASGTRRGKGKTFSRKRTLGAMIEITGIDYGWVNLARAALLHLPVIRFLVRPEERDDGGSQESEVAHASPPSLSLPPFCSQAVSSAMRAGGIDPAPNLADRLTEPGDLARSPVYAYKFTLFPFSKKEQSCEP